MVKFFVFDTFASSLFAAFPFLAEQAVTKLLVSLVAGAVAGTNPQPIVLGTPYAMSRTDIAYLCRARPRPLLTWAIRLR
eukprot:950560-Rhodomonas_salina.1